jgi:ubiquinone/menaquinone biosynthesis C-methylase UbiE
MQLNKLFEIKKRLFAWGMSKANQADDSVIKLKNHQSFSTMEDLKGSFFSQLQGTVLEIGPGAGANLCYYPREINWIGIEPNYFMHYYLAKEAQKRGFKNIKLFQGSAENIPLENNSIDTVISTHVLCSVTNLTDSLEEIKRVLKPGGQFLFIEHIAAIRGTFPRKVQNMIEPVWKTLFDNCHPNRETGSVLEKVGFNNLNYQHFQLSFPIVSPHIAGIATK